MSSSITTATTSPTVRFHPSIPSKDSFYFNTFTSSSSSSFTSSIYGKTKKPTRPYTCTSIPSFDSRQVKEARKVANVHRYIQSHRPQSLRGSRTLRSKEGVHQVRRPQSSLGPSSLPLYDWSEMQYAIGPIISSPASFNSPTKLFQELEVKPPLSNLISGPWTLHLHYTTPSKGSSVPSKRLNRHIFCKT